MLSERDNWQQRLRKSMRTATAVLVGLNIVAYLLQTKILPVDFQETYLELSLAGLQHGFYWQLLSYQFMHGSWPHLLLNCWALFLFGRDVEWTVRKPRFLLLYFSSGVIGGLFQMLAALLWPDYFGGPEAATFAAVAGASAGVFGVVAAFAMLFPDQRLIMFLFYIIPISLRARSLLWLFLLVTALGISFPNSRLTLIFGAHVAHFAHLGGILTGLAFARFYFLRILQKLPPFIE